MLLLILSSLMPILEAKGIQRKIYVEFYVKNNRNLFTKWFTRGYKLSTYVERGTSLFDAAVKAAREAGLDVKVKYSRSLGTSYIVGIGNMAEDENWNGFQFYFNEGLPFMRGENGAITFLGAANILLDRPMSFNVVFEHAKCDFNVPNISSNGSNILTYEFDTMMPGFSDGFVSPYDKAGSIAWFMLKQQQTEGGAGIPEFQPQLPATVFSVPALLFVSSADSSNEYAFHGEFEAAGAEGLDGHVYPAGHDKDKTGPTYESKYLSCERDSFSVQLQDGALVFHFNRNGLIDVEKVENGNDVKVDQRIPNEEQLHNREGLQYEQKMFNKNEAKELMRENIRPLLPDGIAQQNNRFLAVPCLAESNMRVSSGYRSMEKQNAVQAKPLQTAPIKVDEYKKEHARRPIMKPIILNGVENCPIIIVQKRRRVKAVDEKQMAAMLPPPDGGDEQENNPAPQRGELIVRDIQTAEELPVIIINERAVKSKKKKSEDELVAVDDLGESDEAHSDDLQRKRVAKFCGEAANEETEQAASSLSATEA
jgi:hypothetical protein